MLRKTNDNIECGSVEKGGCFWSETMAQCQQLVPTQILQCGEEHKKLFGITGYDTYGHWCNMLDRYTVRF